MKTKELHIFEISSNQSNSGDQVSVTAKFWNSKVRNSLIAMSHRACPGHSYLDHSVSYDNNLQIKYIKL